MLTTLHGLRGQDPQVATYPLRYPLRFGILMETQGRSLTTDIKSNISPTSVCAFPNVHTLSLGHHQISVSVASSCSPC